MNEKLAEEYGKMGLEMQSATEREQLMEEGMMETSSSL